MDNPIPENVRQAFLENFRNISGDFTDFVEFSPPEVGFSVKRGFGVDSRVSLVKVGLTNQDLDPTKKAVFISATFGVPSDGGVKIRTGSINRRSDPLDITTNDDYYFDVANLQIKRANGSAVSGDALLSEFYSLHTKNTKRFSGIYLRSKLWFWRIFASGIVKLTKKMVEDLHYLITGDKYSYDPFHEALYASSTTYEDSRTPQEPDERQGSKFEFLGVRASKWSVVLYSVVHLLLYLVCFVNEWRPQIVVTILKNNFLTIAYVIVSLFIIEVLMPILMKRIIKYLGNLSWSVDTRKVKV